MAIVRVEIVAADSDTGFAEWAKQLLANAGVETGSPFGVAVVVLSQAALRDHRWRARLASVPTTTRLIPVVVGDVRGVDAPERVAEINWIRGDNWDTLGGELLAAVTFEPDSFQVTRLLQEQANAWAAAGRQKSDLIDDPIRLGELKSIRAGLLGPNIVELDDVARMFLEHSINRCSAQRNRRVVRYVAGGVVLALAVTFGLSMLSYLKAGRQLSRASFITGESMGVDRDLPHWTAMSAAAVYLTGLPANQEFAATRLHELIGRQFSLGRIDASSGSIEAVLPDIGSGQALAIMGHEDGSTSGEIFDLRSSAIQRTLDLDGVFYRADISAGRLLFAGPSGAIAISDGASEVLFEGAVLDAWWSGDNDVGIQTERQVIFQREGQVLRAIDASPADVVSTRSNVASGPAVLTVTSGGYLAQYTDPAMDAIVPVVPGFTPIGAFDQTGDQVLVAGDDSQLYRWAAGEVFATGIVVPDSVGSVHWLSDDRVIVESGALGVEVFHLPSGMRIGAICTELQSVLTVTPSLDGRTVDCLTPITHLIDQLPSAPTTQAPSPSTLGSPELTPTMATVVSDLLRAELTFGSLSTTGEHLIVQTELGDLYLFDVGAAGAVGGAMKTRIPDSSPVLSASFGESLQVETANGWWTIPDCRGCNNMTVLLQRLQDWSFGCWSARQLENIPSAARDALGVIECESP